jgi:hypothetical protein
VEQILSVFHFRFSPHLQFVHIHPIS